MIYSREYSELQFETSSSLENITTEMTTFFNITTTISVPPNSLSDDAIVGIVIGIIVLVFLALIIYKYRQDFLGILHRDSKQSKNHSIPDKLNPLRPNITYSPEHEYLTVNIFTLPQNPQFDEKSIRSNND